MDVQDDTTGAVANRSVTTGRLLLLPTEIVEVTVASVGVAGNLLVIMAMLCVTSLRRKNTNKLVVSLAFADLIACVFLILRSVREVLDFESELAWELYCRAVHDTVLWVNFSASVFNLVTLTLERYCAIVHPFRYHLLATPGRVRVAIAVTWTFSIAVQSFTITLDTYDPLTGDCAYEWPSSSWIPILLGILISLLTYFIPLTIMAWSYWRILQSLAQSERRVRVSDVAAISREHRTVKAKKKVVKMFLAVCLTFAICWGPNQFLFLAGSCGYDLDYDGTLYKLSRGLVAVNSCINPFIYSYANKKFRAGVRVLFRCANKVGNPWSTEPNNMIFAIKRKMTNPTT